MGSILELVLEAEGTDYNKRQYVYSFGQDERKFYEGDGPYANNKMGIGWMQIEGSPGNRFVVVPNITGDALFAWLKVNQ